MQEEILLEWKVHPFRENPLKSLLVVLLILIITLMVFYSTGDRYLTGLSLLILTLSLATYLFPTRYQFTKTFILIRNWLFWRNRRWSEFRNYIIYHRSIKLTTLSNPRSRLNQYRGLLLLLPEDNEKIVEFVKSKIEIVP